MDLEPVPVSSDSSPDAPVDGDSQDQELTPAEKAEQARKAEWSVIECPDCYSQRCSCLPKPGTMRCVDCGKVYHVRVHKAPSDDTDTPKDTSNSTSNTPGIGKTKIGDRDVEYITSPLPLDSELGVVSETLGLLIPNGPEGLITAQRRAAKIAKEIGEQVEAAWCLDTTFLQTLKADNVRTGQRSYIRALRWRPRFLATFSLTANFLVSATRAGVSYGTIVWHRNHDPEFQAQIDKAEELAAQVLHAVCWKSAVEGDLEPVFWQGLRVGSIRKMDSRLRIEMLRAHMPGRFKTPANANIQINNGRGGQMAVMIDGQARDSLMEKRRASLLRTQAIRQGQDSGGVHKNDSTGILDALPDPDSA